MDALAAGHDAAVQMIDTSVVRVHQHGACISDNNRRTKTERDVPPGMSYARSGTTTPPHFISSHRSAHQAMIRTRSSQ
jgi:hypothetical protein